MWPILLVALLGQINGPDTVPVYQIAEHRIEGEWESAFWFLDGLEQGKHWITSPDGLSIIWTAPPGKHTIQVFVVNWGQKKMDVFKKDVTWGDAEPEPEPEPEPLPPTDKYQVVIILETAKLVELTPGQLEIVSSVTARKKIESAGHQIVAVGDPDTPPPRRLMPFWAAAKNQKLPLVLRAPTEGGTIEFRPLPDNTDELLKALATKQGWSR